MTLRAALFLFSILLPTALWAGDLPKPDDVVSVNLMTEGWVQAKAARIMVSVNAAVVGDKASGTRDAMIKAVSDLAPKTEWRLTSFNRGQDQTGIEQWSATFEARLPEAELGGIHQKAKAASKAGMQLAVQDIDFTPTLAEFEAVRAELRKTLLSQASKELDSVNAAYPDRNFRISQITFGGARPVMQPQVMMMKRGMAMASEASPSPMMMEGGMTSNGSMETSQKIDLNAMVTFAAIAPVASAGK